MKKIKAVSLAKEFVTEKYCVPIETELQRRTGCNWVLSFAGNIIKSFDGADVICCETGLFKITYEPSPFEVSVPSEEELRKGRLIVTGESETYAKEINPIMNRQFLRNCYLFGIWFPTKELAEQDIKLRRAKVYLNQLREKCNAECEEDRIGYNFFRLWKGELEIDGYAHGSQSVLVPKVCGLKFTSKQSAEMFLSECSEEMKAALKEIIERGTL